MSRGSSGYQLGTRNSSVTSWGSPRDSWSHELLSSAQAPYCRQCKAWSPWSLPVFCREQMSRGSSGYQLGTRNSSVTSWGSPRDSWSHELLSSAQAPYCRQCKAWSPWSLPVFCREQMSRGSSGYQLGTRNSSVTSWGSPRDSWSHKLLSSAQAPYFISLFD